VSCLSRAKVPPRHSSAAGPAMVPCSANYTFLVGQAHIPLSTPQDDLDRVLHWTDETVALQRLRSTPALVNDRLPPTQLCRLHHILAEFYSVCNFYLLYILLLCPVKGADCGLLRSVCLSVSVCICLSASISLEPLDRSSRTPVAVARSSSGGVAILCVLPLLWTMSRLAVVGRIAMHGMLNL